MFAANLSGIGFGSLKTKIDVLRKIADDEKCEEAYKNLLQRAQRDDIMLEIYGKDGAKVSKLGPLEGDTVEISRNDDFVKGIETAIKKLDEEETDTKIKATDCPDMARMRLLGFKNIV